MNKLQELKKQIILAENKLDEILKERSEVAEFMTKNSVELFRNKEEVVIDWEDQKQIERKIDWVEIKQTSSQRQIAKLRKTFWGVDFRSAFDKLYDEDLHNDDTFMDAEENNLWTEIPEEEAIALTATDKELFEFIQDNYWYDITIRDEKTEITFDVDDCTIDLEKGTFKVNYFNENTRNELEEYFEEQ